MDAAAPAISIVRPIDGTVVTRDPTLPETQQALALEAIAPPEAEIVWRVDGNVQGRTRAGGRVFWHPTPGEHRITASLEGGVAPARGTSGRSAVEARATAVSVIQVE